jgi:hypothetical protein
MRGRIKGMTHPQQLGKVLASVEQKIAKLGIVDFAIGLFGRGHAKLGGWPHCEVVKAAFDVIQGIGGNLYRESGTPGGEFEAKHFRVCGQRLRLCITDYDEVSLWGPKKLVADIAKQVADKLSTIGMNAVKNNS